MYIKETKQILLHILSLFILLSFVCCKEKKEEKKDKDKAAGPVIVDVMIASPQTISNTLEVNGTVVAFETAELRPEINGRLTYLNVPEGRRVGKGTVIARINDADLRAQLGKLRVQLALARTTEQRYKKLIDLGGINQADYDLAVNQVNSLEADINILNAQIAKTVVRAPFTGVVGLRNASPGAYVTTADVLATFHQVDRVKVDFSIPEEYAYAIKRGDHVAVQINENNGQRRRALIVAIEPQASTTTRNLQVRALLENGIANPGAFVKVYISGGSGKSSILVPANAIIPEDKDKTVVLVKNGKAKYTKVETGIRQETNVEITSGIQPGDSIVVSGVLFARPNTAVKVRQVKSLEEINQ